MRVLRRRAPGPVPADLGAAVDAVPRIVLRFAVYTALALALAGGVIVTYAKSFATARAEQAVAFHAEFVADTILRGELRPSDLAAPVGVARRRQLDAVVGANVLTGGVVRATLYGPDGTATYSTDPSLIGRSVAVREALAGVTRSRSSRLPTAGGADLEVLDVVVPVRLTAAARPSGAFEVLQDSAPVAAAARESFLPIAGVLGLVLLVLYVALLPLLRRVSRRLCAQIVAIRHQALHDGLTGLPNRDLFGDRVATAIAMAQRERGSAAVLLLDLDRFKDINDTLGHHSGDDVLREIARRISGLVRDSDTAARLGGDEFGVVAPATDEAGALALAERIRSGLRGSTIVAGIELEIEASIGIAVFPAHGADGDVLVRHADVALYVAKEAHEPTLYTSEQDDYSPARLALATELRRALANRELVVHYQPLADVQTGAVTGAEALVRWAHPVHGLLAPDEFVPLAEHTGLIRELTRTVLEQAVTQASAWHRQGLDLSVAVNVTARDLLDLGLPDEVATCLRRHGVAPGRLTLEITENTILTDPARARTVLLRLSSLGVRLAIDDFGSGHSSLGYLKRLPVDVLKIDKAFVLGMANDPGDEIIVRSTIDLGHNLGLRVVAEGVEDAAAWGTLAGLGCDVAQGFLISRPAPATALDALLAVKARRTELAAATGT